MIGDPGLLAEALGLAAELVPAACPTCGDAGRVCPSCGLAAAPGELLCHLCGGRAFNACPDCHGGALADPFAMHPADPRARTARGLVGALDALIGTPAGRRELALRSPTFFDSYYCGMLAAAHRTRWLEESVRLLTQARQTGQKLRHLALAPRSHGKTERGITTLLYLIVALDRNARTCWVGRNQQTSVARLSRVRALMLSDRVLEDWTTAEELGWGPFLSGKGGLSPAGVAEKWTDTECRIRREIISVHPTLAALGVGGALTGGHYDAALVDDPEDDGSVKTRARRESMKAWVKTTLIPTLDPGSCLFVMATRKHNDDLYSDMLRDPTYFVSQDTAFSGPISDIAYEPVTEIDTSGREVVSGIALTGPRPEVLWPEARPAEFLLLEALTLGAQKFAREYQNTVLDDAAAAFKWADLQAAKEYGRFMGFVRSIDDLPEGVFTVVQAWDLSLVDDPDAAQERDSDYMVGVTWARHEESKDRYLLDMERYRGVKQSRMLRIMEAAYHAKVAAGVHVHAVTLEQNAFGELYKQALEEGSDLPLRGHLTGTNKIDPFDGVFALGVLFENNKVVLPYRGGAEYADDRAKVDTLVQELWGLGREKHDDCVMALWIAELALRAVTTARGYSRGQEYIDEVTARQQALAGAKVRAVQGALVATGDPAARQAAGLWSGFSFTG
jgi:phage terminase large subunit-like protein